MIEVFTDVICPFCYVAQARVRRVAAEYGVSVRWSLLEIHPETPAEGMPLEALGYPPAVWAELTEQARRLAEEEGLPYRERTFTTRSRDALVLLEAAKGLGAEAFERLQEAVMRAYFAEGRNIGRRGELAAVAREAGMREALLTTAWDDADVQARLAATRRRAGRLGVAGTPTVFVGGRRLVGAVPVRQYREAVAAARRA
ncbi:DsbA family oxidoreductase [Inmirania thermothiophila]|uniref:Putative DsbA family dithiol-disulfide isomerase n=1 Tax=Inmirania thermothiophila TaxID=1750597 RepID=A0A3N1XSV1_9GAMM|nr:DsbA family protein [Inmirania thermothiophila]ROR29719.1 putative DsbA family dithiol-disulfide isomerase [Inmirania thermothiophila]